MERVKDVKDTPGSRRTETVTRFTYRQLLSIHPACTEAGGELENGLMSIFSDSTP